MTSIIAIVAANTMPSKLETRFYPTGLNSRFNNADVAYQNYVANTREVIERARLDLDTDNRELIINSNSPSEFSNGECRQGILLIHGLLDSPDSLACIASHYRQRGFLVRTLLLPGHGTVPGDLLDVQLDDWLAASQYGINSFRGEVDKLIVAGFSTGASLAIYHTLQGAAIDALLLFAPAIMIKNRFAYICQIHKMLSWAYQPAHWLCMAEDDDYAKYQSLPFNGVHQVAKLTRLNSRLLKEKQIAIPQFLVMSGDDEVVDATAAHNYFVAQASEDSEYLLYTNQPPPTEDPRLTTVASKHLADNILDYSHACVTVSPEHSHYGQHGDYNDVQHYQQLWGRSFKKGDADPLYYGSLNKYNLSHYHLQRLRYNPDFASMMQRIDAFLQRVI